MGWPGSRAAPTPHPKWDQPSLERVEEQLSLILVPFHGVGCVQLEEGQNGSHDHHVHPHPEAIWKCVTEIAFG